jgi:hypothetical protein
MDREHEDAILEAAKTKYPFGRELTFSDWQGQTTKDGRSVLVTGTVNGKPVVNPKTGELYIPVWCEREGREATTTFVAESNLVKQEH